MDSAAIQWQIRNNALEAQEMASDLLKWQQQMKQKEAAVAESSGSTAQQEQHAQLPVVRGRAAQAAPAAPAPAPAPVQADATTKQSQQQHPAAHTYKNYSKWDTYDVDAAVAAAEQDEEPQHQQKPKQPAAVRNSSRSIQQKQQQPPPPPMPDSRVPNAPKAPKDNSTPAAKASALKDQGNKLFQARYYDDAIACYSQSIDALPTAVAFANRAMAYLKLERFPIEAEADCSAALLLDATYVKAWHRRGTARKQLGKLLDAACDFEEALRLEPGNVSLQADRDQALQQHLKLQQLGGRNSSSSSWKAIPVKQQQQPEQQQDTPVRSQQQDQKQQQQEEEKGTQPVSVLPPKSSSPKQSPQQQQASEAVRPVTPPPTAISSSKTSSPQALASPQQRQSVAAAAQAAAQQLAARLASNLRPPKTGHEFEAAWRSFKGDVVLQGKYLSLLQPQQLPTLFKSSLTAQLVSALLTAALTAIAAQPAAMEDAVSQPQQQPQPQQPQQQLAPAHAVGIVEGLVSVPRFDMMVMSIGSRDKAALRQLWDSAAASAASVVGDAGLPQRLADVKPKYRL